MELSIFCGKRDPAPILLQSWRKRGHGQHTFLRRVPVEDDPGQVEHGDEPEAGEQQVDEQQEADDSYGSQAGREQLCGPPGSLAAPYSLTHPAAGS